MVTWASMDHPPFRAGVNSFHYVLTYKTGKEKIKKNDTALNFLYLNVILRTYVMANISHKY